MFKRTYPYFDLLPLYSAGSTRLNVGSFLRKKELWNYLREAGIVTINRNLFNFEHVHWKGKFSVHILASIPPSFHLSLMVYMCTRDTGGRTAIKNLQSTRSMGCEWVCNRFLSFSEKWGGRKENGRYKNWEQLQLSGIKKKIIPCGCSFSDFEVFNFWSWMIWRPVNP